MSMVHRLLATVAPAGLALASVLTAADPLTRRLDIDFGRDVASRDLKGLATRSDGCIVSGPTLTELAGPAVGELLWTLAPVSGSPDKWLVGTGPEGRIVEVTLNGEGYTTREFARVPEPQVVALKSLPGGALLAGTSPTGAVYLIKEGRTVARVGLPADSVLDILLLPDARSALVATGNPGRIYRIGLDKLAAAGVNPARLSDPAALAARGCTLFGEIRDRNVRRLAVLPDGRIAAGSAPRGNVYLFPRDGGPPVLLQENRDAEVTDLLPQPNGDLYASIVYSSLPGEYRINRRPAGVHPPAPAPAGAGPAATPGENAPAPPSEPDASRADRFGGRSAVVLFPADGFPETLLTRNALAIYRLARRGDLLLMTAGEQGDVLAWDLANRLALTFAGSVGSQLNGLAAVPESPDRFLVLQNNAPGLGLLDFGGSGPRRLETSRLDLDLPAELGNLRFARLWNLAADAVQVDVRTSMAADEIEGWTDWTRLASRDGAQYGANLRGRYLKLRISVPPGARDFEIDAATLYHLPQNRRPVLTDFRVLPPNLRLNPPPELSGPGVISLAQLLNPNQPGADAGGAQDSRRKLGFLGSQLVPDPGNQAVYWTVSDLDGDTLAYTFSIRAPGAVEWIDLAVGIRDNYVQFDTSHLSDGVYASRLIVAEQAPRPAAQRLRTEFTTDDLAIDHTPP